MSPVSLREILLYDTKTQIESQGSRNVKGFHQLTKKRIDSKRICGFVYLCILIVRGNANCHPWRPFDNKTEMKVRVGFHSPARERKFVGTVVKLIVPPTERLACRSVQNLLHHDPCHCTTNYFVQSGCSHQESHNPYILYVLETITLLPTITLLTLLWT